MRDQGEAMTQERKTCDICGDELIGRVGDLNLVKWFHRHQSTDCAGIIERLVNEGYEKYRRPGDIARHVSTGLVRAMEWRRGEEAKSQAEEVASTKGRQ